MGEDGWVRTSGVLIGRQGDARNIAGLLEEYALVTLVGPGGVGKTTLASSVTSEIADRFAGGVHVAELAGASDDDDIAGLVSRQLQATSIEALRLRSIDHPTLVVLDNCESALAASREVAKELTEGESSIRILATSRSPLYALGERVAPVQPLSVGDDIPFAPGPDERSPAVQLFLLRAEEAGATWERTDANLNAVRHLTRQLNGLPLAIELAAARSRALGPVELVTLLDRQLDLLVRPGSKLERHHSLRSVIQASYDPLPESHQRLLCCLAFMNSPFTLRLAHAVGDGANSEFDTLEVLSQLIDASLIETRQTSSGATEYLLLDSIRAFGREQLHDSDQWHVVGERYVDAVTNVAGEIVAAALQAFSPDVMTSIRDTFSHLVNAITWCLDNDPSPARSYQMFLLFFGPTGASTEIADLAQRVRETWAGPAPLQAEAYAVMGSLTFRAGRYDEGAQLASLAVTHPDATDMAKLMGHRTLGYTAAVRRDEAAAVQHLVTAMEFGVAFSASFDREVRVSRTAMVWDASGSRESLQLLDEVLAEASQAEEWVIVAWAQAMIAHHHRLLGDMSGAARAAQAALDVAQDSEMVWATITAHHSMGCVVALEDGPLAAAPHFRSALDAAVSIGDIDGSAAVLRTAAGAARFAGDDDLATALWATVPAHPGIAVPPSPFEAEEQALRKELGAAAPQEIDRLVTTARSLLGPGASSPSTQVAGPAVPATAGPAVQVSPPADTRSIVFGEYELDLAMCELRRAGERIALEPQAYDVLAYLVQRRGHVVSKHELLDEVWGDRFVSEGALSSRISSARRATGDSGKKQQVIRTVHGKGFSFVAEVQTGA